MRAAWIVVTSIGCGAAAPVVVAPPVPSPQATPVATPIVPAEGKPIQAHTKTLQRYAGRDQVLTHLSRDEIILLDRRTRTIEQPVDVAEIDFLGRCARDFVEGHPDTVRKVLVDALSHYVTGCEDGKLVLERPLGFDSRERRSRTDVAFVGTLGRHGAGLALKVVSCSTTRFERITVVANGASWTSPRVELRHDTANCDIAELPFTRTLAKVIRSASEDKEATIQFDGAGTELAIDESTRDELRAVLDAVDVISDL